MFSKIMLSVDLAEKDKLQKAIETAADLARLYDAPVTLVSVSGGLQAKVSHSAAKYSHLLAEFAQDIAQTHGIEVDSRNYNVPDPSVEVDKKLIEAIEEIGADLVVMASHLPGWMEYLINSHGGRLATHAPISVLLVR